MTLLFKTTYEEQAIAFKREAYKQYPKMAICWAQHRSNDGNFYYEIWLDSNCL